MGRTFRTLLKSRDLHEGNVLVTTSFHIASLLEPEETSAVLIDFGRGQVTGKASGDPEETGSPEPMDDVKAQDIYDYGALLMDLTRYWVEKTGRTTVPPVLVNIITKCTREDGRARMRVVTDMWELWAVEKVVGKELPGFLNFTEAWRELRRLPQTHYSMTRSVPSSSKLRRLYRDFSVESIVGRLSSRNPELGMRGTTVANDMVPATSVD